MNNRSHVRRLKCIRAEAWPCPGWLGRRSGPGSAAASRCSGGGRRCVERLILVRLGRLHVAAAGAATPAVGTAFRA
jgi:hypothetical protein